MTDETTMPRTGVDRCGCGCKYWDGTKCHDCGETFKPQTPEDYIAENGSDIACSIDIFERKPGDGDGPFGWWMVLSGDLFGPYATDDEAIDAIPANLRSTF